MSRATEVSKLGRAGHEVKARKSAEVLRRKLTAWVDETVEEVYTRLLAYESLADPDGRETLYDQEIESLTEVWYTIQESVVAFKEQQRAAEIGSKVLELKDLLGL